MRHIAPFVLLAALATGCAGTEAATPSAAVPLEQSTPTASTASSPAPPQAAVRVGATQENIADDYAGKVTALRIRQPFRVLVDDTTRPGHEYIGVEAKVCAIKNTGEEITVSWQPWSIAMTDDTVATPLSSWSDGWFSVPLFPQNRITRVGSCVRGWIPFEVPKGSKPKTVTYQPGVGGLLEWTVS